jgi:LmbE family N-acetylglucosaminyl deacetylase
MQNALETRIKDKLNLVDMDGLLMYKYKDIELHLDHHTEHYIVMSGIYKGYFVELPITKQFIIKSEPCILHEVIGLEINALI